MPCEVDMAALRARLPRAHMRPTGGLARTTWMTSSTTGGSVKGALHSMKPDMTKSFPVWHNGDANCAGARLTNAFLFVHDWS